MTRRSRAREVALQLLFQFDYNAGMPRAVLEQFVRDRLRDAELERFALELFDSTVSQRQAIDARLAEVAQNWRLERMTAVDRNVLRLGTYEMLFTGQPAAPIINEAIELARRYGTKNSPTFVNGVLDEVRKRVEAEKQAGSA
jgi:N utilization substance protein B